MVTEVRCVDAIRGGYSHGRLSSVCSMGPTDRRLKPPGQNWKLEKRCLAIGDTLHFKDHDHECRATLDSVVTSVKCITGAS